MTLELALRLTEILLGFAIALQSAEHLRRAMDGRAIFALRLVCAVALLLGVAVPVALLALVAISLWMLHRFNGPYNGGSDKMTLLCLWCLTAARLSPTPFWAELFMAYLAVQLTLSYFVSGHVKIMNPAWRSGQALADVFAFSAYPVGQNLRALGTQSHLMIAGSWAIMLLELLFPLAFVHPMLLLGALGLTACFHAANACLFGLNRFFWAWLCAYPSALWLQVRIFGLT